MNTGFSDIIITFTDQNGRPLEVKNKVNLTLLLINRNDVLTKNKKIFFKKWILVIWKKFI